MMSLFNEFKNAELLRFNCEISLKGIHIRPFSLRLVALFQTTVEALGGSVLMEEIFCQRLDFVLCILEITLVQFTS